MKTLTVNKTQVKKLPLDTPFLYDKDYWEDCVKESNRIAPVFGSNGFYYDRHSKQTWLEVNGEAWLYDKIEGWKFRYDHMGEMRIHPKVYDAIALLMKWNAASKEQRKAFWVEGHVRYIRELQLDIRLDMNKFFKEGKKDNV